MERICSSIGPPVAKEGLLLYVGERLMSQEAIVRHCYPQALFGVSPFGAYTKVRSRRSLTIE